jgi:ABC-type multidrug transport system fused ATPase/permease subunit
VAAGLRANISQSSQLVELLGGIRVIKAYNLEAEEMARFRKTSGQLVHAGMKGVQAKELVNPIIQIVGMIGLCALLLYIFHAGRSGPELVGFITGILLFFLPIRKLAGVHILFEQASVGVHRLMEILAEQPKVVDPPNPRPLADFKSTVTFENVTFAYVDQVVVRDLNLTIPRGFKLGIAGESGSGKTTLVNLLFRFYDPAAGAVKIDGLDLREFSLHDLRQQMALVSQDVTIFDQTVAENIACGKPGATRAEIEVAAEAAFAHDFITQLPGGYNTRVGERGVTLSGGQKQRVAIARAFVRNAPILVLDEATAALDSKAEAEVQAAIDRLAENRTVICIAHRLSTLAAMDRIIVLSEGRMVEAGSFDGLLRKGGAFASMAARQGIFAK